MNNYNHTELIVMLVLLAVIFGLEMLGVSSSHYVTLTHLIKAYIPMPCRWMITAWIFWHFIASDICVALGAHLPIK